MKEKFGVAPEQVVDVLALMGDSIDNIKGVPGIGEKGARDLIATYGSLDALLSHASEVTNKRYREGLLAHAEDARQSRELARIRTDVPVEFDAETLRYRGASRERCFELFTRLGFRTLVWNTRRRADDRQGLRDRRGRWRSVARLAARLRAAGRFGFACCPTHRPRCGPASPGLRSRPARGTRGTCRSRSADGRRSVRLGARTAADASTWRTRSRR